MTGWDEHGHAVPTGLPIDRYLRSGELQDAENCGYEPISVLAEIGIDRTYGRPQTQYRNGRIVCSDGTVLERGGTLNCVWAVTRLPPPDPGVAGSLDKQAIRDATPTSRCGLCGHHAVDHGRSLGGGNMSCAVCPDRVCRHHSGVAGEPEATTKEASEIDSSVRPTQLPVPTPDGPPAADVAGGVVVPDEAVEAAARADHAFGRLGDDPDWDGLTDTDRDSYRRAARSYLAAAAPLIVEHYLRHRIRASEVDQTPEEVWEQVREMARNAAVGTAVVDALRSAAGKIRAELVCCDAYDWAHGDGPLIARVEHGGHGICFWGEASARINDARADELEREADRD